MGATVVSRLLDHYDRTARALPWRVPPGTHEAADPYRVWLSEVMLQQTTVATVRPRFRRFVERWPSVEALAAAREEEVLSEWAGLGYYARARHLHACAREVAAMGGFPRDLARLRALPGIGDYTAAAIASIAFGTRVAAIDTNVERVIARLFALPGTVAEARPAIRARAAALWPADRPGDMAQALMDLGATLCRPKQPDCPACPLRDDCAAFASGAPDGFPAPKPRKPRPHRHGIARLHRDGDALFLVRRPSRGLLGGMAALPDDGWTADAPPPSAIASIAHGFTHFTLDLHVVAGEGPPGEEGWWQPLAALDEAGLPTLYRRAIDEALARSNA